MADLRELPLFIMQELSGPYGPNVTDMVRQIGKWYDAYSGGAEFDLDDEDEEAFEHTRLHCHFVHLPHLLLKRPRHPAVDQYCSRDRASEY